MNYAIYFNKKYKRVGHLWQGRFKSWYVTNEAYLYTLMLYIEQNPLKAKIVKTLEEYPYSSYHSFLNYEEIPECLQDSWVVEQYKEDAEAIKAFLNSSVDVGQLSEMKKASSLVEAPNLDKKPDERKLKKMLDKAKDKKERNIQIVKAYEKGYSQHMIAKVVGISQQAIHGVIKRDKKRVVIVT